MRRAGTLILLAGLLGLPGRSADLVLEHAPVQVYFSPGGGCTEHIVATIGAARKSILVQAYTFTSAPIAGALKAAHDRGVDVRIILDASQRTERYSSATFFRRAGIPVAIDTIRGIAHNKVMVLDGGTVITGSFNFTKSAERNNAENVLIIRDQGLAAHYAANWRDRLAQSEPLD